MIFGLQICCAKQSIHTMDYLSPIFPNLGEQVVRVNRVCCNCLTHWYGVEGDIKQYTRAEWDALLKASDDADVLAAKNNIEVTT